MKKCIFVLFFIILSTVQWGLATTYGSNSAPTRPARLFFPAADADNSMRGFISADAGFFLEDYLTTCSFNAFFPVADGIGLTGGNLYLQQDLSFSNTLTWLTAGGSIVGALQSLKLADTSQDFSIPSIGAAGSFSIRQISALTRPTILNSVDWNHDDTYLISGADSDASTGNELQLYSFDGATLTATTMESTGNLNRIIYSTRWHPTNNYIAVGFQSGFGNDVNIYYKRSNGSFSLPSGVDLAASALAVAWHPSGSFLVIGTSTASQVRSHGFNQSTGVIGAQITGLTTANVSRNAISFAPGGNFLAVGLSSGAGNDLIILTASGNGTLTNPGIGADAAATVQAVDWCPTGTYIAAGLSAVTGSLRIYQHNLSAATLTEVTSARVGESRAVNSVHWDRTGNFLVVGITAGTGAEFRLFYFDKSALCLIEMYRNNTITNTINDMRWSHSGNFIVRAEGLTPFNIGVHAISHPPLTITDLNMVLNADTTLYIPLWIKGGCKIDGRGKRLTLATGSEIVLRPGGSLILEDVELQGLGKYNVRCLTDAGAITLRHSNLKLDHNYTFSRGALEFEETVALTGTNSFIYASGMVSTIASQSTLYVGNDTTFKYDPVLPIRNLLQMTDVTSCLYLDGCTLYSTRTGLELSVGSLICDDKVTISSDALYPVEGLSLFSSLATTVRGGANVVLSGRVRFD